MRFSREIDPASDRLLNTEQVAEILGVSVGWVYGNVPKRLRAEGTRSWRESAIHAWVTTPAHLRPRPWPAQRKCSTYFIHNPATGLIKIGRAKSPEARVRSLSLMAGVHLELLRVIDEDVEERWHEEFSDCREIGEWFRPNVRLLNMIYGEKSL